MGNTEDSLRDTTYSLLQISEFRYLLKRETEGLREVWHWGNSQGLWQLPHQPVYLEWTEELCVWKSAFCELGSVASLLYLLQAGQEGGASVPLLRTALKCTANMTVKRRGRMLWHGKCCCSWLVTAPCAGRSPVVTQAKLSVQHLCI